MGNRIIIAFVIISGLFALSSSRAENELTLEAAIGVASEEKPFTSDWSGSVGPGGLLAREFAFKATYHENQYLNYSLSFGFFDDYDEARTWLFSPLDLGGPPVSIRKVNYIRPTVKLSVDFIKLEMGSCFFGLILTVSIMCLMRVYSRTTVNPVRFSNSDLEKIICTYISVF